MFYPISRSSPPRQSLPACYFISNPLYIVKFNTYTPTKDYFDNPQTHLMATLGLQILREDSNQKGDQGQKCLLVSKEIFLCEFFP